MSRTWRQILTVKALALSALIFATFAATVIVRRLPTRRPPGPPRSVRTPGDGTISPSVTGMLNDPIHVDDPDLQEALRIHRLHWTT